MPQTPLAPGWYQQADGTSRYFDGVAWTTDTAPTFIPADRPLRHADLPQAAPPMPPAPFAPPAPPAPPQTAQSANWFARHKVLTGALVVFGLAAAGNAAGKSDDAPASAAPAVVTSTVVATVTATPTATPVVAEPKPEPENTPSKVAPVAAPATKAASSELPSRVVMPNGVGLNYQAAQDAWRAAGLIVGMAEDATGANRVAVLDVNWVVLEQDLKPGSQVDRDTVITATIKKYTDR